MVTPLTCMFVMTNFPQVMVKSPVEGVPFAYLNRGSKWVSGGESEVEQHIQGDQVEGEWR